MYTTGELKLLQSPISQANEKK